MMFTNLRRLAGQSALYTFGNIVVRGANYALVPIYVQLLAPAEYGTLGIVMAVINFTSMALMFGLYAAANRLYFDSPSETYRKQLYGSLWWFIVLLPLFILVLLDRMGPAVFGALFRQVPYDPYLRLGLWSAYLSNFSLLPMTLLRNREKPGQVLALSFGSTALTVASIVLFLVVFKQGVVGVIVAGLFANLVMAIVYSWLMVSEIGLRWNPSVLWTALAYSLPFWPHAIAGWVLNLSDRILLERFVPLVDVGIYSLGYQIGQAITVIIESGNQAWGPFFFRSQAAPSHAPDVLRVATYFVGASSGVCLMGALLARPALRLLTPPAYWGAEWVAVIITLGFMLLAPYYIWANAIMHSKKVAAFPLVTLAAGVVNVVLNILLIPILGIVAAALNTVIGYLVLSLLSIAFASRVYPLRHEYARWLKVILAALLIGILGQVVRAENVLVEGLLRCLTFLLWVGLLAGTGFLNPAERMALARYWARTRHG